MKKHLLIGLLSLASSTGFTQSVPNLSDPHWQLLWEDQFTDGTINTAKWHVANNFDHWGAQNIVFLDDNVVETGGNLKLTFKKETYLCPAPLGQPGDENSCVRQAVNGGELAYNHTGGYLWSKAGYDFEYGYFEARIKLDYAYGLFPAFWTFYGESVSYPGSAAEIDVFEMCMGEHNSTLMTSNLHYSYPAADPADGFEIDTIVSYDDRWVVFGCEWSPNHIRWYADGEEIRYYHIHSIADPVKIILDIGIQGSTFGPDITTPTQVDMLIDYVKVYQMQSLCGSTPTYCAFNFGTYVEEVKETITIGGCGAVSVTQPAATSQYLWVTDWVTINGDFTVPVGSTFVVQIDDDCYME